MKNHKFTRRAWLTHPSGIAAFAGVALITAAASAQPASHTGQTQAGAPAPTLDWRAEEAGLLRNHTQLTSREMFIKAGESYFDHQSPPRWVVFQAIPVPGKGEDPKAFYSMYVARLRYDESRKRIVGIETPIQISADGSANTCGWFHPAHPWRVLFGSTLTPPSKPETAGYQRGSSRYVWQFPSEMGIVERSVSSILLDLPNDHPMRAEVDRFRTIGDTYSVRLEIARKAGDAKEIVAAQEGFAREIAAGCPTVSSFNNFMEAKPVVDLPRYDAECSFSPAALFPDKPAEAGRFVLYAQVTPPAASTPTPEGEKLEAKTDADIHVYDTKTGKHHALVVAPGYDGGPFFSPDGKFICYRSDRAGNDLLQLFIAELKFEDGIPTGIVREKQITNNEHVNWGPYWHPSGKFLVYATSEVGHSNYEVFAIESGPGVMDRPAEEIRRRRITTANGADVLPSFNDDGKWMMWTAQRGPTVEGENRPSSQVWVAEVVAGPGTMANPEAGTGLFMNTEKK